MQLVKDGLRKCGWLRKLGVSVFIILVAMVGACAPGGSLLINGAGATLPYPLYSKWFDEYYRIEPDIKFNYQSIGSGAGIRQIIQRTIDFGASDAPMSDEQLQKAPAEIVHIPTVIGAVVITYNLPDVSLLKLTPEIIAGIFLGEIDRWNDDRIVRHNPGSSLPGENIIVIHRSDGSGTTNIFTDYLSVISPEWKTRVGKGTAVSWPVGIGAKGNEAIAGQIKLIPYSIGYLELAYAVQNKLAYASIQNQAGEFVPPALKSSTAAAAATAATMPEDMRVSIVDAPGTNAYPIVGYTYILVYKEQTDMVKGKALVDFLWWAVHEGESYASELHYAPLPDNVIALTKAKIRAITHNGQSIR